MSGFTGRKNHGRGHSYWLDGEKLQGVTTVLSKGLPKPALVNWAGKTVAEKAVNEWDTLAELPPAARLARLVKAPDEARSSAAVKGTRIHALADPLLRGEEVAVPEELAGHVESCVRFLNEWDAQPVLVETGVISEEWRYGGTFDMIADLGDGKRWLLDWKTSASGAYGDTAFQLAAYRYADFWVGSEGQRRPVPHVDECGVVWLRADGYDLYPYHADAGVWREFLYIMQTARAGENCRDYKGDALLPPVRTHA